MTLRIATALSDSDRESAVFRALSTVDDVKVVRRCRDVVELRAVGQSAQIDAAVLDAGLRGLDRDVVQSLALAGVRCVVVGDHPLVGESVSSVPDDLDGLVDALCRGVSVTAVTAPARALPDALDAEVGRVVVVWGPMGAPGRTTVAIELASALSGAGKDVLLVDCDTTGPSIAQLVGLLDDTSGVAAAARRGAEGHLTPEQLVGLAVSVPAGPRVLVGLASPERWSELRPAAIEEVLRAARGAVPWTVVDIGPGIEGDDLAWFDPDIPQRFGAARTALAAADVVVCVGRTDPVGVTRLLKELPKVRSLAPTARLAVVLNRAASKGVARQARQLVADVLELDSSAIGEDESVMRAQMAGVTVSRSSPDSELVRIVGRLAEDLLGSHASYDQVRGHSGRTHRRLLRGAHRRHRHRDAGVVSA